MTLKLNKTSNIHKSIRLEKKNYLSPTTSSINKMTTKFDSSKSLSKQSPRLKRSKSKTFSKQFFLHLRHSLLR